MCGTGDTQAGVKTMKMKVTGLMTGGALVSGGTLEGGARQTYPWNLMSKKAPQAAWENTWH